MKICRNAPSIIGACLSIKIIFLTENSCSSYILYYTFFYKHPLIKRNCEALIFQFLIAQFPLLIIISLYLLPLRLCALEGFFQSVIFCQEENIIYSLKEDLILSFD